MIYFPQVDTDKELTPETRIKIINELPKDISEPGLRIHKSISGTSVTEFLAVLESNIGSFCEVMLKKPDKKKDRQILFGHRQSLLEQLESCCEPALSLHLAALYIFYHIHGAMLHASGKLVPIIIEHLVKQIDHLSPDQTSLLLEHQKMVIASLDRSKDEDSLQKIASQLEISMANVKSLVKSLKKNSSD